MNVPRLGFRLRTFLMLVLAFTAGMWFEAARKRWLYCHEVASYYRRRFDEARNSLRLFDDALEALKASDSGGNQDESKVGMSLMAEECRREADVHERLMLEFETAKWLPWRPVPKNGPPQLTRPDI